MEEAKVMRRVVVPVSKLLTKYGLKASVARVATILSGSKSRGQSRTQKTWCESGTKTTCGCSAALQACS